MNWLIHVFSHPSLTGLGIVAAKTAVIYIFLIVGLRLLGKREMGQMNIYDLVLIIVLANAVQNAMVGDDTTLAGGVVAACTLLLVNRLLTAAINRSPKIEKMMVGEPRLLVNHGTVLHEQMRREGVTHEELMAALREHGMERVEDAHLCVLEIDGSISVVPSGGGMHSTRRHYRGLRLP